MKEMNDYDNDIIRIKTNPWIKVQIPQSDRTTKRAISAEDCRRFFSAPLPPSKMVDPLPELGHDIAKLVLCLAGMNTIDLYELKKEVSATSEQRHATAAKTKPISRCG